MDIRTHFEPRDPAVAAPVAAALVTFGAAVSAVATAVEPPGGGALARAVAVAVPVLLLLAGVALFFARRRRPSWTLTLVPLGGLLAIAALDLSTDATKAVGPLFYCCPVLYAASQLRTGAAVLTTAVAAAMDLVVAFALIPPGQSLTDVLYLGTTMVTLALVLIRQGRRHDAIVRELQEGRAALSREAATDGLTGLPNRVLFHRRVHEALASAPAIRPGVRETERREAVGQGIAVLFCDLDGFKAVNDRLGHRAGDELLVAIAGRLRSHLRVDDVVARLGGDEFAVLVHDTDARGARAVGDRLLAAFTEAVPIGQQRVHVGVSIGIALAAPGTGADVDSLVREADVAMYEAKANGRGRCVVFAPAMLAAQVEQASLLEDLHGAVARGEITVAYQPVVDLQTGAVDGLEALARWTHPRRGAVSPATFIPVAERSGLIDEIGAHVLAEVNRDAASFAAAAGRQVSVGVNVAARQLTGTGILDLIPTGRTEFMQLLVEVTESTLVRPDAVPVLQELRRRGVRIAMDDFGVGQSSIAALRLMPVDVIKLDRGFTQDITTDPRAAAVVRAMTTMADDLDLPLVAEGIETTEQLASLTGVGGRYGQGYLLARPMSARATCEYLGGGRSVPRPRPGHRADHGVADVVRA
jgi:diguanylate cyclase (GGDEF)-like protein